MNNLYIVATPIGNLQDTTIRAIKTLFSVDYILCENPERTKILLMELKNRFPGIIDKNNNPKVLVFNEFSENEKLHEYSGLLDKGFNLAVISSAGTPLISDPGFKLVRFAISKGVNIVSVPGVTSVVSSLVVSGLPSDKFLFSGFLPKTKVKRKKILNSYNKILEFSKNDNINPTLIIFESPHRIIDTLIDIKEVFGDIDLVIVRELTKKFEEIIRDNVSTILKKFKITQPIGEFVILLNIKN